MCEWNPVDVNVGLWPKHATASPTPKNAHVTSPSKDNGDLFLS